MPNWVHNIVKVRGDEEEIDRMLDAVRNEETGEPMDFCRLVPVPDDLMIEHGAIIPRALSAYLSAVNEDNPHCDDWHYPKMPESMFGGITYALMDYSKLTYYIATGCSPFEFEKDEYELEKLVSLGRKYADNYFHYGFLTWYDYCRTKWGTKWNANYPCQHRVEPGSFPDAWEIEFDTAWSAPTPIYEMLVSKFPTLKFEIHWADEDFGSNTGYANGVDGVLYVKWFKDQSREAFEHAAMVFETTLEAEGITLKEEGGE